MYIIVNALIAGSIGPLGATLHDRSEYSGLYVNNFSIEVKFVKHGISFDKFEKLNK